MLQDALSVLNDLPLFSQWNLCLLWGGYMLCFFALVAGWLGQKLRRNALPPIPTYPCSVFPNKWDAAYAFFFLALVFCNSSTVAIINEHEIKNFTIANAIENAAIYLPMLLRILLQPINPKRWQWPLTLVAAFGAVLLAIAANGVYMLTGLMDAICDATGCPQMQDTVDILRNGDTQTRLLMAFTAIVVAPICEECCFRGFLYNALKKKIGIIAAMGLSSLLFAAVHTSLAQTLPLFFFSLLLSILYEKSRSLRTSIVAHAIFNALSVLAIIFLDIDI